MSRFRIAAAAVAAGVGLAIAGCGSATSTPAASQAHTQTQQPDVRVDMRAWMASGGYDAFANMVDRVPALNLTDPSSVRTLTSLTNATARNPVPAIVDRAGAHPRTLGHLAQVIQAVKGGDMHTATVEIAGYNEDMNALTDEVYTATRAMANTGSMNW